MNFSNAEVSLTDLPVAEELQLNALHPLYLKLLRIEWLITAIVVLAVDAALVYFIPSLHEIKWIILLFGATILLMILYFVLQENSFKRTAYAVRTHDVIFRKGWLIRSTKICPFNRVQNCTLIQGPLERKYGLATLSLFTAGSSGADMRIPGLDQQEAERLRHYILSRINGNIIGE